MKYQFKNISNVFTDLFLFSTGTGGTILKHLTGSNLMQNTNHYLSISYAQSGEYSPVLVLSNSGGSVTRFVFLGGTEFDHPLNSWIVVTEQGSPLYTNTGSFLGQFGGTGGVINKNGIFALDFKIGWGNTGNTYLDTVQGLLSPIMYAMWWVSQKLYSILASTDLFAFLFEIIHPANGTCYTLPNVIFDFKSDAINIPMPSGLVGTHFCIAYTQSANAQYLTKMLYIIMSITILFWVLDLIIPNRNHD